MTNKIIISSLLTLILTLMSAPILAQEETAEMPNGYRICDWGLVIIQPDDTEPNSYITITSPANYSGVTDTSLTVTGTGQGLFENNVVIQVRDTDGNQLFEEATVMETEEIGGEGEWSIEVELGDLEQATHLVVEAYSQDPATGMNTALDNIFVNANSEFGLPYVEITSPVWYGAVNSSPIIIEGTAGAAFENNIIVQILDYNDSTNILAETFATVQTDELAGSGPWIAEVDLELDPDTIFGIRAFHPPVADGEEINPYATDSRIGVISPLALNHDQILVLKSSDLYTGTDDFCGLTKAEFDNESIIPIVVNDVKAVSTMSMMPLVNVTVNAQKPSQCDLPLRIRITGEDNNFSAELYYSTAEGEAICTRDLQLFTTQFSLGTLPNDIFSLTVNNIELKQ